MKKWAIDSESLQTSKKKSLIAVNRITLDHLKWKKPKRFHKFISFYR